MPHLDKQVIINPPAPIDLIRNNADQVWETIGGYDQRVLTQFLEDAKSFEDQNQPVKIWKFDNEVEFNPDTQRNDYYVKVWFETKGGQRLLYNFSLSQGEQQG